MRIAIFHDYFRVIGGGEKLVLTLARHLGADVITTDLDRTLIDKMGFSDVRIISLGSLVSLAPFKQIQATLKFALCDFSRNYDFFIFSGNWAHYASRKHHPNLLYCHTPVRAFYDQREKMIASRGFFGGIAVRVWTRLHGYFDRRSIARIDRIITNSQNTSRRIRKYYGRNSIVVYPPCDTVKYCYQEDGGYWLSVNRLYPEKRIDLQVEAFRQMPDKKLLIIGNTGVGDHSTGYAKRIKQSLPPNISILSDVPESELIQHYNRCTGFLTTAVDEDFGMTAVEAMASGKPVIAVKEGGYLESVVDGATGRLVSPDVDAIVEAIRGIGDPSRYRDSCVARSRKFDSSQFFKGIDAAIGKGDDS